MQVNLAFLYALAYSLSTTTAQTTENNAVTVKTFPNEIGCGWGVSGHTEDFPDGTCLHLPRDYMDVKHVTDTCRVFIYMHDDCSGFEEQIYQGGDCIDIRNFRSIKAFCH